MDLTIALIAVLTIPAIASVNLHVAEMAVVVVAEAAAVVAAAVVVS